MHEFFLLKFQVKSRFKVLVTFLPFTQNVNFWRKNFILIESNIFHSNDLKFGMQVPWGQTKNRCVQNFDIAPFHHFRGVNIPKNPLFLRGSAKSTVKNE